MTSQLLLSTATLLFTLDLIGTFVFALSGAVAGVEAQARSLRRARAVVRRGQRRRHHCVTC